MPYRIEFVGAAKDDLRVLRKSTRVKVLDRIETHLSYQPTLQGKSRIKTLRPGTRLPYRLRVDEFRVYYDVNESEQLVIVYGIVEKAQSAAWLSRSTKEHLEGERT
jgi:mRNA-degrading endonuclease RelE of RelBE toxin-antitoxin system